MLATWVQKIVVVCKIDLVIIHFFSDKCCKIADLKESMKILRKKLGTTITCPGVTAELDLKYIE